MIAAFCLYVFYLEVCGTLRAQGFKVRACNYPLICDGETLDREHVHNDVKFVAMICLATIVHFGDEFTTWRMFDGRWRAPLQQLEYVFGNRMAFCAELKVDGSG